MERRAFLKIGVAGCAALVVGESLGCKGKAPKSGLRPGEYNVILVSLDTVRADHLGCYGYHRDTCPTLDRFAKEGVLFENMTCSSSWTLPAHISMLTSLYPSVHGVEAVPQVREDWRRLGEAVPTLAEVLGKKGYTTAGFVTGPVMNRKFGFDKGFQEYDDYSVNLLYETSLDEDLEGAWSGVNHLPTNHVITDLVSKWLREHGHEKFFLFVHYWDPHDDYIPPSPYDRMFDPDYQGTENGRSLDARQEHLEKNIPPEDLAHLIALYDGEIRHTDRHVRNILKVLDDMKLSKKTLVIMTSDHGEGFMEHGKILHGNSLFEELLHSPLMMRLPGLLPAGLRVKGNVSHVDLMPTILGLLRISEPPIVQGTDLSPVCLGMREVPDRIVLSELDFFVTMRAVRWGPYKLIQEKDKDPMPLLVVREGTEQDAREAGVDAKQCEGMEKQLAKALHEGSAIAKRAGYLAEPTELDQKTIDALRTLGYME